jgi:LacI family transcriptional regulator
VNRPINPATMRDVADAAGVSTKTVSLVVNDMPGVGPMLRARIKNIIETMRYRPNATAQSLAARRSQLIGLLIDEAGAQLSPEFQVGILEECAARNWHLALEAISPASAHQREAVCRFATGANLRGVILAPPLCDCPDIVLELVTRHVPFVRVAPEAPFDGEPYLAVDDFAAAQAVTRHLLDLGHRRIGFVRGPASSSAARARFAGYEAALRNAGLPLCKQLCCDGDFSFESGVVAAEHLLCPLIRPTAVFAADDNMAAGVVAVAHKYALKIPEQISIAGFGASGVGEVVWPALTTCRLPAKELGRAAFAALVNRGRVAGPFQYELLVRDSTAGPNVVRAGRRAVRAARAGALAVLG